MILLTVTYKITANDLSFNLQGGGPGGLRSHDFRLSPTNLEGRRSIHAELRARANRPLYIIV